MSRFAAHVDEDDDPPMVDPADLFPSTDLVPTSDARPFFDPGPDVGPSSGSRPVFGHGSGTGVGPATAPGMAEMEALLGANRGKAPVPNFGGGNMMDMAAAAAARFRSGAGAHELADGEEVEMAGWVRLFPIYFDAARSRTDGRQVGRQRAVQSPLASKIAEAVRAVGLPARLDPVKTHPNDWANPGMVLTQIEGGGKIKSKKHLVFLVSEFLRKHPTSPDMAVQFAESSGIGLGLGLGAAGPGGSQEAIKPEPAGVPRGWKIGSVLPLHSPAVSEGVNEEGLKQMMASMTGMPQLPGMGGPAAAGAGTGEMPKKVKKKVFVRRR